MTVREQASAFEALNPGPDLMKSSRSSEWRGMGDSGVFDPTS